MNSFLKFIPGLANDAKEKVQQVITNFKKEDAFYLQKENLKPELILEKLNSTYQADITDGLKGVLAVKKL